MTFPTFNPTASQLTSGEPQALTTYVYVYVYDIYMYIYICIYICILICICICIYSQYMYVYIFGSHIDKQHEEITIKPNSTLRFHCRFDLFHLGFATEDYGLTGKQVPIVPRNPVVNHQLYETCPFGRIQQ